MIRFRCYCGKRIAAAACCCVPLIATSCLAQGCSLQTGQLAFCSWQLTVLAPSPLHVCCVLLFTQCECRCCAGTYVKYHAKAIGSGSEGAQTALEEAFKPDMSLKEAEVVAVTTLKQVSAPSSGKFVHAGSAGWLDLLFLQY